MGRLRPCRGFINLSIVTERDLVFADEIEKLGDEHGTDWRTFLQLELFGVLDREIQPRAYSKMKKDPG